MNLERLKFAWARGAKIEINDAQRGWVDQSIATPYTFELYPHAYRIHPDDEHLQYGPVSTAFRDMALFVDDAGDYPEMIDLFLDMAGSNWLFEGVPSNNIESDFCRLFMAEYLADEGL